MYRDVEDVAEEIPSMPDQFRWGVHRVVEHLRPMIQRGLKTVLLFGVPSHIAKVLLLNVMLIIFRIKTPISLVCDNQLNRIVFV